MAEFKPAHITVSAEITLDHPARDIWPLLCPVREYDWIEMWECEVLRSESGYIEPGCVFRTDFPGEGPETWLTCRHDPMERIEFVRTGETRIIHFILELEPLGGRTKMTWTHHVTALDENGNAYVKDKPHAFAAQMEMLKKMLDHYLKTGEMLKIG
jgi:hypothetical protein